MRGAATPRTPRLKRKDTLHAYRVAANATDYREAGHLHKCRPENKVIGSNRDCIAFSLCRLDFQRVVRLDRDIRNPQ